MDPTHTADTHSQEQEMTAATALPTTAPEATLATPTASTAPINLTDLTEASRAVILSYMDTLTTGDFDALREFFAPDVTWTLAGDLPLSRTWVGPGAILDEFVPAMVERFVPGTMELEFEGVVADGERVLAEWNTRAIAKSGLPYDQHCLAIFTVRDGRIAAVREYFDTLHAKNVVFA